MAVYPAAVDDLAVTAGHRVLRPVSELVVPGELSVADDSVADDLLMTVQTDTSSLLIVSR